MRIYSTPLSVQNGEISVLAIVETFLAIGVLLYVSIDHYTLHWFGCAIAVTPLSLLRTPESVELGIAWYDTYYERLLIPIAGWSSRLQPKPSATVLGASLSSVMIGVINTGFFTFAALGALVIRILATALALFRTFPNGLKMLPSNWTRVVLATDVCHAPEMIPGHNEYGSIVTFASGRLRRIKELYPGEPPDPDVIALHIVPLVLIGFLPAYFYRWSLKATAIVFLPLLWIARSTFRKLGDLKGALSLYVKSDLTHLALIYSCIFLVAFLAKIFFFMTVDGFLTFWQANGATRLLGLYVAPAEIPIWQIASVLNACIAVTFFLFGRHALLCMEHGQHCSQTWIEGIWRVTTFIRWSLTFYTLACTIYITFNAARGWVWPQLGEKVFPWIQ